MQQVFQTNMNYMVSPRQNHLTKDASLFMHCEQVSQKNVDAVMQCYAKELSTESQRQFSTPTNLHE